LGAPSGAVWTAHVSVPPAANLLVSGGNSVALRLAPAFTVDGGGGLRLTGGVRAEAPLDLPRLDLSGAAVPLAAPATAGDLSLDGSQVTGGALRVTHSATLGTGALQAGSKFAIAAGASAEAQTLNLSGGAQLVNDGELKARSVDGQGTLTNAGTLTLMGGAA